MKAVRIFKKTFLVLPLVMIKKSMKMFQIVILKRVNPITEYDGTNPDS